MTSNHSIGTGIGSSKADAATPALRLLFWESTAACNLSCVHCRRLDVSQQLQKDDLTTQQAVGMIHSLPEIGGPILVFSGGEPLLRPDILELAQEAKRIGLPTALATNGTIMNEVLAKKIVDAGIRRTSMSFDGPTPSIHDAFRGIPGAFEATVAGFRALREQGMSMQINTTIARHNYAYMDDIYQLALEMGADALHFFMLVPVGCGMELKEDVKLSPQEYETALNWIYDRSQENRLQLKATCAPHYFRVVKQRQTMERRAAAVAGEPQPSRPATGHPGGQMGGHPGGGVGGHPGGQVGGDGMNAVTKGCLAGQAVCFVSHTGEVFPCGYLPVSSGNVKTTPLPKIWRDSVIFSQLRETDNLEGKCGCCEFNKVCMGCRARAYADTGNFLEEEPNCSHVPVRMQ